MRRVAAPTGVLRARTLLAAGAAGALGACGGGGPPADLFVVERDGSLPAARLTLRLTDDGGAYCNRNPRRPLTSALLIQARAVRRALNGEKPEDETAPADRNLRLAPGPRAIMRYVVRSEDGTVAFSDTSRGQPRVFYEVAKLTRDVAKGPCGLPR